MLLDHQGGLSAEARRLERLLLQPVELCKLILPSKFSTSVWRTKILKETTCLPRDRLNVNRHPQDAQEISLCCFAAHSALVLCSAKHND